MRGLSTSPLGPPPPRRRRIIFAFSLTRMGSGMCSAALLAARVGATGALIYVPSCARPLRSVADFQRIQLTDL